MNETPPTPPVTDPEVCAPIPNMTATFESVLRHPQRVVYRLGQGGAALLIGHLLALAAVLAICYGLVVGTFSGGAQMWVAPVKIAGGLLASALICLPSLYVLACLGGSRASLREVCGLLSGLLALMTVLLIGFAPVAWVFSQSTESADFMGSLHLIFALVSIYFGLRLMKLGFAAFGRPTGGALGAWIVIFLLVVMQMTTSLRPIVGTAETILPTEKKFFLRYWFENIGLTGPEGTRDHR